MRTPRRWWVLEPDLLRWGAIAVGVLALVALLGAGAWAWYSLEQARGEVALAQAAPLVDRATLPETSAEARDKAIAALEAVIAAHPRLSVLPQVAYQLGNLRYAAGQYAQARAAYELALSRGAPGIVRALSSLSLGYTWEAEGQHEKAEATYAAALRGFGPKDFLYEDLLAGLGRVQEASGKRAAAAETYKRLLTDLPDSPRADAIRARLASLYDPSSTSKP